MIVRKSFKFRLKPTKKQAKILQFCLDECRYLYNVLLEQRKLAYEELAITLSKYQQLMFLPSLKDERPALESVHSQVLQNVVDRLDKAFQAFFRRVKKGDKAGFPRFRGENRYRSLCYPQSGFALNGRELKLSKIGTIRLNLHQPLVGTIKTCTIQKTPSGEWEAVFSCEVERDPLPENDRSVGIDMGLEHFATLFDGKASTIPNPKFFQTAEKKLAKAQRKLAKQEKGTSERAKARRVVAKIHEKVANQRKNFCHQESRKVINHYQNICIEDLNICSMVEDTSFAKKILDASWNQFRQYLTYKAEEAGRKLGVSPAAYTSQDCSQCGYRESKELSQRQHCCKHCGYMAHRDINAAQNILALGLDGLGIVPRSLRL